MIKQIEILLQPYRRGYHLITHIVENEIGILPETGILNLFIKHSSAGLSINENADPSVRVDFETIMNKIVPENDPDYIHTIEGNDDMPAHIKASLLGSSLSIPISNNRLNMGIWQGIYLCEFRNRGGSRKIIATIYNCVKDVYLIADAGNTAQECGLFPSELLKHLENIIEKQFNNEYSLAQLNSAISNAREALNKATEKRKQTIKKAAK